MTRIFQVDAFTDRLFGGNPAAVVPLNCWLGDQVLQSIAMENNLAETAFIVPLDDALLEADYELRWFTPTTEVALCGHATLATAHVLVQHLGDASEKIVFLTRQSGKLSVVKAPGGKLSMSFPAIDVQQSTDDELVASALGAMPRTLLTGHYSEDEFDYVAVFDSPDQVAAINPDKTGFRSLKSRGVIVTAASEAPDGESSASESSAKESLAKESLASDFVSRYFAPNYGIDEDPVTGSAHCILAPYWGSRLNKSELIAHQISSRGGTLECRLQGHRTILTGNCVDYLQGEINLGA